MRRAGVYAGLVLALGAGVLAAGPQLTSVPSAEEQAQQGQQGQGQGQQGQRGRGRGRGRGGQQADPRDIGGGRCSANPYNCVDTPNPIAPPDTVWVEEMTWMDVRDALKAGKTTVIIPTGGVEPNGPWLATGKHNYVLRANCDAIARKLGDALCAPIVKFVPEGNFDPPSGHMRSPGTITVSQATFQALLGDIVHSFKVHGFRNIILIGDSGGNTSGMQAVADKYMAEWGGNPVVAHVREHYDYGAVSSYLRDNKILEEGQGEGLHDDPVITMNMMVTDPNSVRWEQRAKIGKAAINGVSIADKDKALEIGRKIVEFRATVTADAIRKVRK